MIKKKTFHIGSDQAFVIKKAVSDDQSIQWFDLLWGVGSVNITIEHEQEQPR